MLLALILLGLLATIAVKLHRRLQRSQSQLTTELVQRRRTEAALRQSEERYLDLFEHLSLGLFQASLDGRLMRVNPMLAADGGYASPEEMVASVKDAGRAFAIPEFYLDPARRSEVLRQSSRNRGRIVYEAQFCTKTGEARDAEVTLRLVDGGPGQPPFLEGSVEDVTAYKRALHIGQVQRDLGIRLDAASSLAEALPLCLEAAIRAAGMDSGEIYLADANSPAAVLAVGKGFRPECLARTRQHADLMTAILNAEDEPVYTQHREAPCELCEPNTCDAIMCSRAVIPVLHEGTGIGWLVVKSHRLRQVAESSRAVLETVASQIGSAIARIRAQEELAAGRRQLRTLLDSLSDFLIIVDSQGRIVDVNLAVVERFGHTRQELRGMHITKLHPSGLNARVDAMASGILVGDLNFFAAPMVAKDGTVIPVETRFGLGTWDGQTVVIGLGRDLTERRKAEEQTASLQEKTALLKEIHHRVKNNLQMISSLLNLQATRLEPGPELRAFQESQAQVHTIALLHQRLYQSRDLARIELGDYLGTVAADILRAHGRSSPEIGLRLESEPVWRGQDTLLPCGLMVNELVTNACKHAFRDRQRGEIHVSVKPGADHTLVLVVGDDGVGLPADLDPRRATTLGLQLVDDMVSQLKGSWTVEPSAGTLFRIILPAERGRSQERSSACLAF